MKRFLLDRLSKTQLLRIYNELNNKKKKQLTRDVLINELMKQSYKNIKNLI